MAYATCTSYVAQRFMWRSPRMRVELPLSEYDRNTFYTFDARG
jgi:hypothetical protein